MKKLLPFLVLLFCLPAAFLDSFSQNLNFPGLAPSFSISVHGEKLDFNFLTATKIRTGYHTVKNVDYPPRLLEIYSQLIATRKLDDRWQIASGYGFQRNNPFRNDWRNEHRLLQQVMFTVESPALKFNQRLRVEERWFSYPAATSQFATRVRYLAAFVKHIHPTLYWQINNEVYATTSGSRFGFITENWLYSGLGFPVKSLGHFETGIGYNSVLRSAEKEWLNLILLQVNWSFVIPAKMKSEMHPVLHSRHF